MTKYVNGPHAAETGVYSDSAWNVAGNLDPWVASSLLQKAIRRGEVALAVAAGLRLHQLRGAAIWSRLLLITIEDIGIASPTVLSLVVKTAKLSRGAPNGDFIGHWPMQSKRLPLRLNVDALIIWYVLLVTTPHMRMNSVWSGNIR